MTGPAKVHYEREDVRPGAVVRWGIVLGLTVVVAAIAAFGLMRLLAGLEERQDPRRRALGVYEPDRRPPEPRLQSLPPADLAAFRGLQEHQLTSDGWLDQPSGTVHLKIDRAMKLWVERQATSPQPAPSASAPAVSIPTDSAPAPTLPHEPAATP